VKLSKHTLSLAMLASASALALASHFCPEALAGLPMIALAGLTATRSTTEVANFESAKLANQQYFGAKSHIYEGTFELAVADASGAVYGLMWVHKSWHISDIQLAQDAVDSGTDFDLGLYSSPGSKTDDADLNAADTDGDHDVYGAAHNLATATTGWTSRMARDPANLKRQVWEDAGATSYALAKEWYLLALTANYDVGAVDTISFRLSVTMPGGA
jgi:hypothetical protein